MEKFKFDKEFQWSILQFTIRDKHGYKALLLYKPNYFILLEQQVIAKGLHRYFKRKKRLPQASSVLNEEMNTIFQSKEYAQTLLEEDREKIKKKVRFMYQKPVGDGDEILDKVKLFASYIELKNALEDINIDDFSQYQAYSKKIQKAINTGMEVEDNKGRFLVAGHQQRIASRYVTNDIYPTPFRQINQLTNAGGYTLGSLIVLVDRPKRGKTWALTNVATAYMRRRGKHKKEGSHQLSAKKIIYIDLENGETAIEVRFDQQLINKSKKEILDHQFDDELKKIHRQFRRLGGEIYTIRMPSGSTTDDFQKVLDDIYSEYGIKFEVAVVDYAAIMGSRAKDKDDLVRISNVYLDLKTWAMENQFDAVWTAHHVKREAYGRRYTKYEPSDLAKCTDIERHIDALYGIQQNEQEEQNNVMRMEMIVQRDGFQWGRALFWTNRISQRLTEFNIQAAEEYNKTLEDDPQPKHESAKEKEDRLKKQRNSDL